MVLRPYEKSDFENVWELHNAALHHVNAHGGNGSWDDDLKNIQSVYLDPGGRFLVGLEEGKIVAMGALRKTDEKTAEIKRMRVHRSRQGLGVWQEITFGIDPESPGSWFYENHFGYDHKANRCSTNVPEEWI